MPKKVTKMLLAFVMILQIFIPTTAANAAEAEIEPLSETTFTVVVENGTGSGDYEVGESVSISATVPANQRFVRWESTGAISVTFTSSSSSTTTFIMPEGDVTVRAVFEPLVHTVTVRNGTITGGTSHAVGSTVNITAITPPAGQQFSHWAASVPEVVFANLNAASTSFTMPARNVTITAVFMANNAQTRTLTVQGGTGSGTFVQGTSVSIQANLPSGQRFVRWEEVNRPSGATAISFANATSQNTTFTMPNRNVTVRAVIEPVSTITSMRHNGVMRRTTTLRSGPSSSYANRGEISGNTNVRITGRSGNFYRIDLDGSVRWVRQTAVARTRQNAIVTQNTRVRDGRSSSANSLTRVRSGDRLTIERNTGSWSRVTVNGQTGWIRNRYIAVENAARPGRTTVGGVRVHRRPNSDSSVRHTLPRGAQLMIVQRTSSSDGWTQIRIRHHGGTLNGWVRSDQIERQNYRLNVMGQSALRAEPSGSATRVATLPHGTNVSVRGRAGSRYFVRATVSGRSVEGWIHRDNLTRLPLLR